MHNTFETSEGLYQNIFRGKMSNVNLSSRPFYEVRYGNSSHDAFLLDDIYGWALSARIS